ncbi:hypothetical protein GCM10009789_05960 [Kribbella sancticallisti]|uniref:YdhG-like domain-containing protein n=1 Tax=Kribbella sancticallisti TaxID=460087 RepID=A0ABN2CC94_9ACTN
MGRERNPDPHQTFAGMVDEVVTAIPAPAGQAIEWCQPIGSGKYTDEFGVRWHIRGGELPWKRIERLIHDPQVRVLRAYQDEIRDVLPDHREGFIAMIRPYLDDKSVPADGYTDFRAGEFKDDQRRSLLVVEETC